MKRLYFSLLLLLFGRLLAAQSDVCVFLTDGNVMRGTLVKHSTEKGMELVVADTTSIFLPYAIIDRVDVCKKVPKKIRSEKKQLQAKGWYDHLLIHSLLAQSEFDELTFGLSLQYAKGYQWNDHFGAGLGISLDAYDRIFTSLLAETRGQLYADKTTPYYVLRGGYTMPVSMFGSDENQIPSNPGWVLHPAIGMQFTGRKNANFTLEVGFRWQHYKEEPMLWDFTDVTDNITFRRTTVSFGWRF